MFARKKSLRFSISVALLALSLGACSPIVDQRGHVATPGSLEKLEPGKMTREDVNKLLGSPSTTATFDDETWYYISQRIETTAFWAPEVTNQKVVALTFDKGGVLKEVSTYTLKDGKAIALVDRKTPTAGKELSLLDQLFGNIGRFSSAGSGYSAPSTITGGRR